MITETFLIVDNFDSKLLAHSQDYRLARELADNTPDTHVLSIGTADVQEFINTFGVK